MKSQCGARPHDIPLLIFNTRKFIGGISVHACYSRDNAMREQIPAGTHEFDTRSATKSRASASSARRLYIKFPIYRYSPKWIILKKQVSIPPSSSLVRFWLTMQ